MKVYQTSRNVTQYVCDVRRDAEREGDRGRGRGRKREREVALVCNNIVIPYVREQCVESQQENLMEAVLFWTFVQATMLKQTTLVQAFPYLLMRSPDSL